MKFIKHMKRITNISEIKLCRERDDGIDIEIYDLYVFHVGCKKPHNFFEDFSDFLSSDCECGIFDVDIRVEVAEARE